MGSQSAIASLTIARKCPEEREAAPLALARGVEGSGRAVRVTADPTMKVAPPSSERGTVARWDGGGPTPVTAAAAAAAVAARPEVTGGFG